MPFNGFFLHTKKIQVEYQKIIWQDILISIKMSLI